MSVQTTTAKEPVFSRAGPACRIPSRMALMKVKATVERVLEKNLQDLVRGIRNNKENEAKYIAECIEEIKQEMRTGNVAIKAIAVNKLTYLEMQGYDISWAAFNIIEVMSSPKFTHKRVGYLAASQSFHAGTDVLMLTTNMIRKDLCSAQLYDVGVAMSGLSCFMSPDLARDIANDVMTLMTSSKAYVRKKAILLMYKVFLCYPDALRVAFPRLKERLEDADAGVQAAAVNVIGELARKNPRNYLSLAPVFFKLMTTSTSNWVLIKIIKLFAALTPLEPRLGKKLIEPLTNLIHSTSAMSLLYECINTVIAVLISITSSPGVTESAQTSAVQLCVQKLRILIEDSDQNLKYLGLLAMGRILKTHPKSVQAHKDLILNCLDDKDESIRLRALDLLYGMISKKTLMEIVKKLLVHAEKAEGTFYRDELLAKVIDICSQNNYQFVTNFEWYVSVLVDLTRVESTRHGALIAAQMLDVAIRVPSVRAFAVSQMAVLVDNVQLVVGVSSQAQSTGGVCEVFYAAVFLCAEFFEYLNEPSKTLAAMLRPKVSIFPGHIQSVFVHNALKLWVKLVAQAVANDDSAAFGSLTRLVRDRLPQFVQNADLEVQERASVFEQLVRAVEKLAAAEGSSSDTLPSQQLADELAALFAGELNPVAPKAQKKVPIPEGLDLDSWINEPPPVAKPVEVDISTKQASPIRSKLASPVNLGPTSGSDFSDRSATSFGSSLTAMMGGSAPISNSTSKRAEPSNEEMQKMREQRQRQQQMDPNYLKPSSKPQPAALPTRTDDTPPADTPPGPSGRDIIGLVSSDKFLHDHRRDVLRQETVQRAEESRKSTGKKTKKVEKGKKGKLAEKARARIDSDNAEAQASVVILSNFEMPDGAEGAEESAAAKANKTAASTQLAPDDPHRALAEINLDEPLKDGEEKLPERKHRTEGPNVAAAKLKTQESQKRKSALADESLKQKSAATPDSAKPKRADAESDTRRKKTDATQKPNSTSTKKRTKKTQEELIIQFDEMTVSEPHTNGAVAQDHSSSTTPKREEPVQPVMVTANNDEPTTNTGAATSARSKKSTKSDADKAAQQESNNTPTDASQQPKKKSTKKKANAEKGSKARQRSGDGDRDRREYEQTFDDLLRNDEQPAAPTFTQPNEVVAQLLGQSRLTLPTSRLASFKPLSENSSLKLVYQIGVQLSQPQQFTLVLGFVATTTDATLRRFEFTVLDTMNTKLCRDAGKSQYDAVPLAFQLVAGGEQQCNFTFSVESINVLQKLRGSVSYIVTPNATSPSDAASGISASPEKLDFVLTLPCSAFLLGATADRVDSDRFAALLSSGELSTKYNASAKLPNSETPFQFTTMLDRLTTALRLQLVERVDDTASLYARTIQRHEVCILLKYAPTSRTMTIDGKSTDSSLISNLVDEIKTWIVSLASGTHN